ncbi:MAG TPA: hypothetical protein VKT33_10370 [Candidatus Angelobacter sp.]|nr:hypothetical protein [Candidatus Angelobacter sp.]
MSPDGVPTAIGDLEQSTRISRAVFLFAYACFIVTACSFMFVVVSSNMRPAAQSGFALGVLFTARWAVSEWRKIKKAESSEELKAAHRAVELKCVIGMAVALVVTGAYGYSASKKNERDRRLHALAVRMDAAESRNAAIRSKFVGAVREHSSSMSTYIQRCKDVESTLDDYESVLREIDGQLAEFADLMPEDKAQPEVMRKIVAIDMESLQPYRREVMLAKQLAALSPENQQTFYENNIVAVLNEEERLALQEIKVMQDAKASGIMLPDNLLKIADQ